MKIVELGDPHLGRKFKSGIPLHRLGERERLIEQQFLTKLDPQGADLHVCMGDLFDKFVVPIEVLLFAVEAYREAANRNPETLFVVMRGNHDMSRDITRRSSFDLFELMVGHIDNIKVVTSEPLYIGDKCFIGYDAFIPALDAIQSLREGVKCVYAHYDFTDFGGPYVLPTKLLAEKGIKTVVNGHDHIPRIEKRDGVTVRMTGSMQPLTHAEDPDHQWYITLPLCDVGKLDLTMKNVRVRLQPGEILPTDIDCLSMIGAPMRDDADVMDVDTEAFESLDVRAMLASVISDLSVKDRIMEKFDA